MTSTLLTDPIAAASEARPRPSLWVVPGTMAVYGGVGVLYGAAVRAWMRLVSDNPGFSWAGTLFIIGAFVIGFAMCGLVAGGRKRGWQGLMVPTRIAAVFLCLPCFTAAGAAMIPTIIPGAIAYARTDWPRGLRVAMGVVAALGTGVLLLNGPGELGWGRLLLAFGIYCALVLVEIRVFAEPYRPTVARLPLYAKIVLVLLGLLAALLVVTMAVGIATADRL